MCCEGHLGKADIMSDSCLQKQSDWQTITTPLEMKVLAVRACGEHAARTWWNFDICDAAQGEFQFADLHGWSDGTLSATVHLAINFFFSCFHYVV